MRGESLDFFERGFVDGDFLFEEIFAETAKGDFALASVDQLEEVFVDIGAELAFEDTEEIEEVLYERVHAAAVGNVAALGFDAKCVARAAGE